MKNFIYLFTILFSLYSCGGKDKMTFEEGYLPKGHWQSRENPELFFSIGSFPRGVNRIWDNYFFISTPDSILSEFYVLEDIVIDEREKTRTFETNINTYVKLIVTDDYDSEAEFYDIIVYGPTSTLNDLDSSFTVYKKLPEGEIPPFSDSVLYHR